MEAKKLKPFTYKRMCIKWRDSMSFAKVWYAPDEIFKEIRGSEKSDYIWSIGYLFKETKQNYYLANSIDFQGGAVIRFGQIFSIPKGCVSDIQNI